MAKLNADMNTFSVKVMVKMSCMGHIPNIVAWPSSDSRSSDTFVHIPDRMTVSVIADSCRRAIIEQ